MASSEIISLVVTAPNNNDLEELPDKEFERLVITMFK